MIKHRSGRPSSPSRKAARPQRAGVAKAPSSAVSELFQEAVKRHQGGDFAGAETAYRAILARDASHDMVWSNLSATLTERGRFAEAEAAARTAIGLVPHHLNAGLNLATALRNLGEHDEAIDVLRAFVAIHPNQAGLWKCLAATLTSAGRPAEAIAALDALITLDPINASPHVLKAEALKKMGRVDEAIACFAEAVRLDPADASAYSSMGILLALDSLSNDLDKAAALCLRGAALAPDRSPILNNLGVVLQIRNDTENALLLFRQIVQQDPTFAPAYSNIGSIHSARAQYDEAEEVLLKALSIDPSLKEANIEIAKVRRYLCNWDHAEADAALIRALVAHGTNFLIVLMTLSSSGEEQLAYATKAMAAYDRFPARAGRHRNRFDPRRLRIGYLSADFKDHPVGRLVPDLIALHDRDRFDIIGYSLGPDDGSVLRRRLVASFDKFVDLDRASDMDAAAAILADEIDILVDLTGPTAGSRYSILALRPAPVQVSFLGLPGTIGVGCIDYIIGDRFLIPPGSERFYREQVVRLPACYQPSDTQRRAFAPAPGRAEWGLPERGFVFCSFNSPVKINPDVFAIWMRLLAAVENSVLWLYCKSERTKDNMRAHAERLGIAPERLVFTRYVVFECYLSQMTVADLFLDTFPYNAGATCNDALWAGLPVLTCAGETYTSRMAGSLLTALGLDELVTHSLEDYERLALDLATDPSRLAALKEKLRTLRADSTLFDMQRYTIGLEAAYSTIASIASRGEAPRGFDVDP